MPRVGTTLGAPTLVAMDTRLHSRAVGMPAFSSSFASVDPQRVPVPHVAVRMAACTPARRRSMAHSLPNLRALPTEVPFPTVTRYS